MVFVGWVLIATMWGVVFFAAAHWYRHLLRDQDEPKYTWVWRNRVL